MASSRKTVLAKYCNSGFEIIILLMKMRDDKAIALKLCNVIPELSKISNDIVDFCPS